METRSLVVCIVITCCILPAGGQGWTYQPIGEGWQADEGARDDEFNPDYRYISYSALLATGNLFQYPDLVSYVQLVVDEERSQLLVGGRDCLFRLHLDNLTTLEMAMWQANQTTRDICQQKGQKREDCHNFVRVMLLVDNNTKMFTCGTFAFNPQCTWRPVDSLNEVSRSMDGRAVCPYSPTDNATALMTDNGDLYAATVVDISARDPAINRMHGPSPILRTKQFNSRWLNEPNFVSAYEIGDFIYFFFRETSVEFINCGKKIYSRVARVCKKDRGGTFILKENWTTFLKARINCSLPGNFPFYFDELQSTYFSHDDQLLYAIFTTPPNSIAGSAVCVYNMTSFFSVFDGPFKYQESPDSAWTRHENNVPHSMKCGRDTSGNKRSSEKSSDHLGNAIKYQLMDQAVLPRETGPVIMRENERWTHVVVDHVATKRDVYDVLFLATEDGKVRKMLRLPGTNKTCLIEEIKIVPNGLPRPVKNMKISPLKGAVYITTEGNIMKIPVQRCYRFTEASLCIAAQDPYCGWNTKTQECTPAPNSNPHTRHWEQDFRDCPRLSYAVSGGWTDWSPWSRCRQVGADRMVDQCLCRSRSCDNPKPANGGAPCFGESMEVTNCTIHGHWTEWSEWSACSQTCGFATRQRKRHCGNPPPRFGGRLCAGRDTEEQGCRDNPECPLVPVDGKWSVWSGWSTCTRNCNSGIQTRKRTCDRPPPRRGGMMCVGNKEDWRMCNTHACDEISKISPWTEWVQTNRTHGGYFEQRFRFTCRAAVENSKKIKTSYAKSQARFCYSNQGGCYKANDLRNTITSIDTFSSVDRALKKYCRHRRRLFKKYCKCRTLGVFLVCQKCGYG